MYVFLAGTQRPTAVTAAELNMSAHPKDVYIRTPYVCTYSHILPSCHVCIHGGNTEATCSNGRSTEYVLTSYICIYSHTLCMYIFWPPICMHNRREHRGQLLQRPHHSRQHTHKHNACRRYVGCVNILMNWFVDTYACIWDLLHTYAVHTDVSRIPPISHIYIYTYACIYDIVHTYVVHTYVPYIPEIWHMYIYIHMHASGIFYIHMLYIHMYHIYLQYHIFIYIHMHASGILSIHLL